MSVPVAVTELVTVVVDSVRVLDHVCDPVVEDVAVSDTLVVADLVVVRVSLSVVVVELVSFVSFFHSGIVMLISVKLDPAAKVSNSFPRFVRVPFGWMRPASPFSPSTMGWAHSSLK